MVGGRGHDTLKGGPGNDRMEADDGWQNSIRCGKGNDTANMDRQDDTVNCETLE